MLQYGPSYRSREAAIDALEGFYASGEIDGFYVARIERRGSRFVILLPED